jgi:hypothetical protein
MLPGLGNSSLRRKDGWFQTVVDSLKNWRRDGNGALPPVAETIIEQQQAGEGGHVKRSGSQEFL